MNSRVLLDVLYLLRFMIIGRIELSECNVGNAHGFDSGFSLSKLRSEGVALVIPIGEEIQDQEIVFLGFSCKGISCDHVDTVFGEVFRLGVMHLGRPIFMKSFVSCLNVVICLSRVMVTLGHLGRLTVDLLSLGVRVIIFCDLSVFVVWMGLFVMFVQNSLVMLFALLVSFGVKTSSITFHVQLLG